MVRKSYGKMRGTRFKLQIRRKPMIHNYIKEFNVGDMVHVNIVSSSPCPHPRFHGLAGVVTEKRGSSYTVKVSVGHKSKEISLRPEHLKLQG